MKILIIGSGSREHALAWHFRQDPRVQQLFIAPGNAGTASLGTNLNISATDIDGLTAWARAEKPDLTFVGPEAPLCLGVVDTFQAAGLAIFGPNQKAARLEASKIFTKEILLKHGIPTAAAQAFTQPSAAYDFSRKFSFPQVIKADGLAAGKGVVIAQNVEEARVAIENMMEKKIFGEAGARILIENCLTGQEISILLITDGQSLQILPPAQDHKRLLDGDLGPNTGGMGAYAPAPILTSELADTITQKIVLPTLNAFLKEGIDYQGVLYIGLMLTPEGPQVLEFNVRLGDPEAQVLLPLLKTPLYDIALAVIRKELGRLPLAYYHRSAVGVVLAAQNYPETPRGGDVIEGLVEANARPQTTVFHGGTTLANASIITSGGRILTVTSWADTLSTAQKLAYEAADLIKFDGVQYRRDIGARSLTE